MTPEHKFTLLVTALTACPTLALAALAAYWTWRRDQERLIVQKSPMYWKTFDGTEGPMGGAGIVVRNLSLYPVRVSALAFRLEGDLFFEFDRDQHADEWPLELPSRARMLVATNMNEWPRLTALKVQEHVMSRRFVAVAVSETNRRFASDRMSVTLYRPVNWIREILSKKRKPKNI